MLSTSLNKRSCGRLQVLQHGGCKFSNVSPLTYPENIQTIDVGTVVVCVGDEIYPIPCYHPCSPYRVQVVDIDVVTQGATLDANNARLAHPF